MKSLCETVTRVGVQLSSITTENPIEHTLQPINLSVVILKTPEKLAKHRFRKQGRGD